MTERVRTVCPRNCYSTCGMIAHVEKNRLIKVEGDHLNRATCGRLCQKGYAYLQHVYHPHRLKFPLKQMGRKGSENWKRITWDEALSSIAERLDDLRQKSEENSVLFYQYSGSAGLMEALPMAFWHLYGGVTATYGSLCWGAGIEADQITFGDNVHSAPWNLSKAKLIFIWGKNPANTNVHEMRFLFEARENGAQIVVIDPKRTATSEKADVWIRSKPGTDAALALGLGHILVKEQLFDAGYVEKHTVGWSRYAEHVQAYNPSVVSAITGVSESDIHRLAVMLGTIKPCTVIFGYGPQRFSNGGQTVRSVSILPVMTGNVGKPGGGWQFANLQSFLRKGPLIPPAPPRMRNPIHIGRIASALGSLSDPNLKFGWIQSANPVVSAPSSQMVKERLTKMDYLIVSDMFMTDTAQCADLVLPAKSMFEQTDVMSSYWHPYLQIRDQCIPLYEEALPESDIFHDLAGRMNLNLSWFPHDDEKWINDILARNDHDLTLDKLREGPVIPSWAQELVWTDHAFATASGKIEIDSVLAKEKWAVSSLPEYTAVEPEHTKIHPVYSLQMMSTLPKQRIHSQFQNLPWMGKIASSPLLDMHPDDALKRGIKQGDFVIVRNNFGELTIQVHLSDTVLPGIVHLDQGWDHATGAVVNRLTKEKITDMGNGTAFHDCWVEVHTDGNEP